MLQRAVTLGPHFRPQLAAGLGLSSSPAADADVVLQYAQRHAPRLHCWAVATLERASAKSTFHFREVVKVRARAVPEFEHEAAPAPSRSDVSAALEGMLMNRKARGPEATQG